MVNLENLAWLNVEYQKHKKSIEEKMIFKCGFKYMSLYDDQKFNHNLIPITSCNFYKNC